MLYINSNESTTVYQPSFSTGSSENELINLDDKILFAVDVIPPDLDTLSPSASNFINLFEITLSNLISTNGNGEGDINEDGIVDILDLLLVIGGWGECWPVQAPFNTSTFRNLR